MAGQVHTMIQKIIAQKSRGNSVIASSVRTKMILRGIMVNNYTEKTPDDPAVIQKLKNLAKEFDVIL